MTVCAAASACVRVLLFLLGPVDALALRAADTAVPDSRMAILPNSSRIIVWYVMGMHGCDASMVCGGAVTHVAADPDVN